MTRLNSDDCSTQQRQIAPSGEQTGHMCIGSSDPVSILIQSTGSHTKWNASHYLIAMYPTDQRATAYWSIIPRGCSASPTRLRRYASLSQLDVSPQLGREVLRRRLDRRDNWIDVTTGST